MSEGTELAIWSLSLLPFLIWVVYIVRRLYKEEAEDRAWETETPQTETQMVSIKSEDRFNIKDRGIVYVAKHALYGGVEALKQEVGKKIEIDGKIYVLKDAQQFHDILIDSPNVGLLVEEV